MRPKDLDGMANSVAPDKTDPIWVYTVCLDLPVQKLRINMIISVSVSRFDKTAEILLTRAKISEFITVHVKSQLHIHSSDDNAPMKS